jgi:uncharacterized repeat protein (TIGR03803 family)
MKKLLALLIILGGAVLGLTALGATSQAQTFSVLYNFGAGGDGAQPLSGVTLDRGGNIYGTTCIAGHGNAGTVFELKNHNGSWLLTALHEFLPANGDGACPLGRVVFGPDGRLYGTTSTGGFQGSYGIVFSLAPSPTRCSSVMCPWNEKILYSFMGDDGMGPGSMDPVFDSAGNLYGTTQSGGADAWGVVFKLTRSGGNWSESVLHSFDGISDGLNPETSVLIDAAGNIFGTTDGGLGQGQTPWGTVWELTPSGSGYTVQNLHVFNGGPGDGGSSHTGLIPDGHGNYFSASTHGGSNSVGAVFELSPAGNSWNFSMLYQGFTGDGGPWGPLAMDAAGNLYGTAYFAGPAQQGMVFKLSPDGQGGWTYTNVHVFTGGDDGGVPFGGVTFDASGNLYGTASGGGRYGRGVVWKIVP